jgi:hypothetical protein
VNLDLQNILWVVVILGLIFGSLLWQRRNPYVISRAEMKEAMERVIAGNIPAEEWERLLRKPIKRDRYLNSLRENLLALPRKAPGTGVAPASLYEPTELALVAQLLAALTRRGDGTYREK